MENDPIYISSDEESYSDESTGFYFSDDSSSDEERVELPLPLLGLHLMMMNPHVVQHLMRFSMLASIDEVESQRKRNEAQRKKMSAQLPTSVFTLEEGTLQACCAICMEDFEENETLKKLVCEHRFHGTCIDTWILQQPVCPLCKSNIGENLKEMKSLFSKKKKEQQKKKKDEEKKKKDEEKKKNKEEKDKLKQAKAQEKRDEQARRRLEQQKRKQEESLMKRAKKISACSTESSFGTSETSRTSPIEKEELHEEVEEIPLKDKKRKRNVEEEVLPERKREKRELRSPKKYAFE